MGEQDISGLFRWDPGGDPNLIRLDDQLSHLTQEHAPLCLFPESILKCCILGNVGEVGGS